MLKNIISIAIVLSILGILLNFFGRRVMSNRDIILTLVISAIGLFVINYKISDRWEGFMDSVVGCNDFRGSCTSGNFWADKLLQQSTNSVKITPTVPLVLPKNELPLNAMNRTFNPIDCTSDLECNYPLKCCENKCRPPIFANMLRGDNLYIPQRIKVCPTEDNIPSCHY